MNSLSPSLETVVEQVQHNCNISDANHAGDYTLCIYLLKMREYYRWLNALEFSQELDSEQMSQWLRERESVWDQVIDEPYAPITLEQQNYDAFDIDPINQGLSTRQLFYHAGMGQKAAHHFFIADLISSEIDPHTHTRITVTGKEYARDLTAPPAISTRNEIIVRQESLKRLCWERYQEWNWNRYDNAMGTALSFYPFDISIADALQQMVETEQYTLIHHEIGEMQISQLLGSDWSKLMLSILGSKAELLARSMRDHLADCISTLPFLIEQKNPASLHFYFANLTYMRKELFPSAMTAYQHWTEQNSLDQLNRVIESAIPHWQRVLESLLEIDPDNTDNAPAQITELIEKAAF